MYAIEIADRDRTASRKSVGSKAKSRNSFTGGVGGKGRGGVKPKLCPL